MVLQKIDPVLSRQIAEKNQADRMIALKERLPENKYLALTRVPPRYIGRLTKALTGTKSKKLLIRSMCEQCVGWEDAHERIKNCSSHLCALHLVRPHQDNPI